MQSVIELYVEVQDWEEAFVWAEKHPEYRQLVYVPYATSLAEQDKFLQAQKGKSCSLRYRAGRYTSSELKTNQLGIFALFI